MSLKLQEWISVIKKVCQPDDINKIKDKSANNVKKIKEIFDKNCSNCKKMSYEQFRVGLDTYFKLLLGV